jgi:hypothetical protein
LDNEGRVMKEVVSLLASLSGIALVLLVGYAVVRLARRRPWATLTLLLALIGLGTGALIYAGQDGSRVDPISRKMEFGSLLGRWCFGVGGVLLILGIPALPLVIIARERNGADTGPVGGQWAGVLFGYFIACGVFSAVLYSLLTGIVK